MIFNRPTSSCLFRVVTFLYIYALHEHRGSQILYSFEEKNFLVFLCLRYHFFFFFVHDIEVNLVKNCLSVLPLIVSGSSLTHIIPGKHIL